MLLVNGNVVLAVVYPAHSDVTAKMTVAIIVTKPDVQMSHVLRLNFCATMVVVYHLRGNVIRKMIVVTVLMKVISVLKKLVHISR